MAVTLFIPCFIDQLAPQVGQALVAVLERLKIHWHYPPDQTCCGQFALTMGDFPTARRLMRHFLRVFRHAQTIVCPSASCTYMVRHYYPRLAEGSRELAETVALAARTFEAAAWLAAQGPLPWRPHYDGTLVLHRSCKATRLGVLEAAGEVLSQVGGLVLKEVSPYYSCCGFGGVFKLQHPELAREIGRAYLDAVLATGAGGVVSQDYSCLMHLQGVAAAAGLPLKFIQIVEIL